MGNSEKDRSDPETFHIAVIILPEIVYEYASEEDLFKNSRSDRGYQGLHIERHSSEMCAGSQVIVQIPGNKQESSNDQQYLKQYRLFSPLSTTIDKGLLYN